MLSLFLLTAPSVGGGPHFQSFRKVKWGGKTTHPLDNYFRYVLGYGKVAAQLLSRGKAKGEHVQALFALSIVHKHT